MEKHHHTQSRNTHSHTCRIAPLITFNSIKATRDRHNSKGIIFLMFYKYVNLYLHMGFHCDNSRYTYNVQSGSSPPLFSLFSLPHFKMALTSFNVPYLYMSRKYISCVHSPLALEPSAEQDLFTFLPHKCVHCAVGFLTLHFKTSNKGHLYFINTFRMKCN
jgi:hypothetical protein